MNTSKKTIYILIVMATLLPGVCNASAHERGYTATRYPIVLIHGLAGFKNVLGVLDYWHRIPESLEEGGADVYVATISQFHSTEVRGEQALKQIKKVLAKSGAEKVNLIGHSHGGLDARYVAAVAPELIASVTTVGTPHRGAEFANFVKKSISIHSSVEATIVFFGNCFGRVMSLLSGHFQEQDALASLESLTSEALNKFNTWAPRGLAVDPCDDGPEVQDSIHLYSWSGTQIGTNWLDASDVLFRITSKVYFDANDGMADKCGSHFGKVIRDDYGLNHIDEINGLWGLVPSNSANPVSLFRIHANRLKNAGL